MNLKQISKEALIDLLEEVKKNRETQNTYAFEGLIDTALRTNKPIEFWTCSLESSLDTNVLVTMKDYKEQYYLRYFIFGNDNVILNKLLTVVTKKDNADIIVFEAISEEHWQLVQSFLENNEFKIEFSTISNIFVVDAKSLKSFSNKLDYSVDELTIEETDYVDNGWEFKTGEFSYSYIYDAIKYNPSLSVRNYENVPISYEAIQLNKSMGHLTTNELYRRQGLACFVITALAKKVLANQDFVHAYVTLENETSAHLHKKCGFICKPSFKVFHALVKKASII